ncbi:MAG: uroporphyrinogen-III C-methyltransferase [Acidimicrobiales bacterium]
MTVYLVGAGPGDPGLVTRRAAELLGEADVVVYDRLVGPDVLAMARPDALLIDVGKRPGQLHRQSDINGILVDHGRQGGVVVRLKGGDPFLFGRGGEEAEALRAAGLQFEVVPGVTSAFGAPAYAGIPVTHRGLSTSVTVVTGHVGEPLDSSRASSGGSSSGGPSSGEVDWAALAKAGGTLVILLGVAERAEIAHRLMAGGRDPSSPVAVVEWGTLPTQTSMRTTLSRLEEAAIEPPAVIVVGPVAAIDLGWFESLPLHGIRVLVTRARAQSAPLRDALRAAGADVVEMPMIQIVDPADGGAALRKAAASAPSYDWVAFTSVNSVERFVQLLRDGRALGPARLAVVGNATAAALRTWHLEADLIAEPQTAEGLAAVMPPAQSGAAEDSPVTAGGSMAPSYGRGRVLFPRAAEGRDVLAPALRAKGWLVDEVDAYRTVPADVSSGLRSQVEDGTVDVVTFTSPSTVRSYVSQFGVPGNWKKTPVVACMGPVTAEAARTAGIYVDVVAAHPTVEHLVAGLVELRASGWQHAEPAHGKPVRDPGRHHLESLP